MALREKTGIPGFENETVQKQNEELQRMFLETFKGEQGRIVLTSILEDLCFFRECKTEEEHILNNFAKFLMSHRLGIANSFDITNNLLDGRLKE